MSELGWNNCLFSDDNLSSKKSYPGYQHKATGAKSWSARVKTSDNSMSLHMHRAIAVHKQSPPHYRKKPDKREMELMSERAAAVYETGQELLREIPITPAKLKEKYYDRYETGCNRIEVDISAALLEKNEKFNIRDIGVLAELILDHQATRPVTIPALLGQGLAQDEFDFSVKQIAYDKEVYRVHWAKTLV